MATADNASAGNFGLMDQVQAINWVRENIRFFNGDPDRITLFGPDAGAASAGLLAMSPPTRSNYHLTMNFNNLTIPSQDLSRE